MSMNALTTGKMVDLTSTATLVTTGRILDITADTATTGTGFSMSMDGLTTGALMALTSDSATTGIRSLVTIKNDNALAVAAVPFVVTQDSTNCVAKFSGTSTIVIPVGTSSNRGFEVQGGIRYNTTTSSFEGYGGSQWGSLGGVIDVDQDTYITAEATTDSDNLDFWTAGTKQMTIDQAGNATFTGDVSVSNLTIDKNIVEKLGTATSSGTTVTIDLATGNNFIVDLESTTGNITTFTINNTNSTANSVTTFIMKVIQGSVDRVFVWSGISAVKWPDSLGDGSLTGIIPPVITTGNDKEDIYSFTSYNNGSTWYGRVIGMDYS